MNVAVQSLAKLVQSVLLVSLAFFVASASPALAATYVVSPDGADTNPGTSEQPWQTLKKGVSQLKPGDTLKLESGTYTERLYVSEKINGTNDQPITIRSAPGATVVLDGSNLDTFVVQLEGSHLRLHGITVQNAPRSSCIRAHGNNIELHGLTVQNCQQHGVQIDGTYVTLQNSTVTQNSQENADKQGKWSSGVKIMYGGAHITIRNNRVHKNYGEGIAVTRGRNVTLTRNDIYDNFSANLYIDNSSQVTADDNLVICKPNSGFERDGRRANGISLSEELYGDWGAQLSNVTLSNNIVAYCHRGISYYSAEVSNPGLRSSIIKGNILWDSQDSSLYIGDFPETNDTIITENTIHSSTNRLATIGSRKGLSFSYNTWIGDPVPDIAKGEGDVYKALDTTIQPANDRNSFKNILR